MNSLLSIWNALLVYKEKEFKQLTMLRLFYKILIKPDIHKPNLKRNFIETEFQRNKL